MCMVSFDDMSDLALNQLLGYLSPKELGEFTRTSKANYELVYGRCWRLLSKLNRTAFLLGKLLPERIGLSRSALAERAFQLVSLSDGASRREAFLNMAVVLPKDKAISYLEKAFEEAAGRKKNAAYDQWQLVKTLHPLHPESARVLAQRIGDNYYKTVALIEFEKNHAAALESAKTIKNAGDRDDAYREIAECFSDSVAIGAIEDLEKRADAYRAMAKRKSASHPEEATALILQACEVARNLTSEKSYAKNQILLEAVRLLAKLGPEKIKPILPLCKLACSENYEFGDKFRSQLVQALQSVDVAMAEEIALSGEPKYTYASKAFWRLISIHKACYKTDPVKANQLLDSATQLIEKMQIPYDRVRAEITVAQAHLLRNDHQSAMCYIERARKSAHTCSSDLETCVGLAYVASTLFLIDRLEAYAVARELVQLFTSKKRYVLEGRNEEDEELLRVVNHNFPAHAITLLEHIKSCFNSVNDIGGLYTLASSIGRGDSTVEVICALIDSQKDGYTARANVIVAKKIHKISPEKAMALTKLAIKKAGNNASDLVHIAEQIALLYPRIAARLYLDVYELNKNSYMLVESARLIPERALDLLNLVVENPKVSNEEASGVIMTLANLPPEDPSSEDQGQD